MQSYRACHKAREQPGCGMRGFQLETSVQLEYDHRILFLLFCSRRRLEKVELSDYPSTFVFFTQNGGMT